MVYGAYIVTLDNKLVCRVKTDLPSGAVVEYSTQKCENALNANIEYDLVNASKGKISRAKKWYKEFHKTEDMLRGEEIHDRIFYLS